MKNLIILLAVSTFLSCVKDTVENRTVSISSADLVGKWQDECVNFFTVLDLSCAFYTFKADGSYVLENETNLLRITDGTWAVENDSVVLLDPYEIDEWDSLFFTQVYSMTVKSINADSMLVDWRMHEKDSIDFVKTHLSTTRKFIKQQ